MQREHQKGFTLVELLVVISIISLLSSVVLSAVNTTKQKAARNQTLSIANEYRNAIELYRLDNPGGGLPNTGDIVFSYCLGSYPITHSCGFGGGSQESVALQTALSKYLPTLPTAKQVRLTGMAFDGPIYGCTSIVNSVCTIAIMSWGYDGNIDDKCLGSNSAAGWCNYTFQ